MSIIINSLLDLIVLILNLYIWIVIISALLSFVNPDPRNQFVQIIRALTEPLYQFIRQKMPFVVVSGIDLSPLIIIFAINVLIKLISSLYIG